MVELAQDLVLRIKNGKMRGDEITLSLWDLGGQDVFSSLHHLFLSRYALYLVTFDMRDLLPSALPHVRAECLKYVRFWLTSIDIHARDEASSLPPVFLLGTHKDLLDQDPDRLFGQVKAIGEVLEEQFKSSHAFNAKISNFHTPDMRPLPYFPVDNVARPVDSTIVHLMAEVEKAARNEVYVKREVLKSWISMFDALRETAKTVACLPMDAVLKLGLKCGLGKGPRSLKDEVATVVSYLHGQGRLLYYSGEGRLSELVVLDPTKFLVEPATRIICDFSAHPIEAHGSCSRRFPEKWNALKHNAILNVSLLSVLWTAGDGVAMNMNGIEVRAKLPAVPPERHEQVLDLMIKFGLAVELVDKGEDGKETRIVERQLLIPAILKHAVAISTSDFASIPSTKMYVAFLHHSEQKFFDRHSVTSLEMQAKALLPAGLFVRLLGKCVSWGQGGSSQIQPELSKTKAYMSFGGLAFEMEEKQDAAVVSVCCELINPQAVARRLEQFAREVASEAFGGSLLPVVYIDHPVGLLNLHHVLACAQDNDDFYVGRRAVRIGELGLDPLWLPPTQELDTYDLFNSYRWGEFDQGLVGKLFEALQDRTSGHRMTIFWDTKRLKNGKQFQNDFMHALAHSLVMVPFVSKSGLKRLFDLTESSDVDNVLVEWTLGVELQAQGRLKAVFPLLIGAFTGLSLLSFSKSWDHEHGPNCHGLCSHPSKALPEVVVRSVVRIVKDFMSKEGLTHSSQLETRTVRETYTALVSNNMFIDVSSFMRKASLLATTPLASVNIEAISKKVSDIVADAKEHLQVMHSIYFSRKGVNDT
jgi:hypothetical protein